MATAEDGDHGKADEAPAADGSSAQAGGDPSETEQAEAQEPSTDCQQPASEMR